MSTSSRYFFLAVVDVQANYLTGRAFQYTTLTSVQVRMNTSSSMSIMLMPNPDALCHAVMLWA